MAVHGEEEPDDREPFALHSLNQYSVEQELLGDALDGLEPKTALEMLRARAVLPPGGDTLLCFECGAGGGGRGGPGGFMVGPETLAFLRRLGRESLETLALDAPGPQVLRQAEELCCRVRRQFLQRELRSYEVIHKTRMGT